jgi:hypothetical protein
MRMDSKPSYLKPLLSGVKSPVETMNNGIFARVSCVAPPTNSF